MPGVTLMPNSSGNGLASSHNDRFLDKTPVADIKLNAREAVNREARGASAITLIKTARAQTLSAKEHEAKGDLRNALASFIKAATLAKMAMDSNEFAQETRTKGGVLRNELTDFVERDGRDINARVTAVEDKLKAIEVAQPTSPPDGSDAPKSIADRLRALQNNGLSLGQTKLREATKLPTPPVSPGRFSAGTQYNHLPAPSAITPSNSTHSTHTFVSPSTLGPPSPTSTPSSSPPTASLLNDVDLTGFAQAFPTIDELDEHPSFSLPSVPTGIGASLNKPYATDLRQGDAAAIQYPFRTFTVPIERPSSTPITPTNNNFNSRPPSPNKSTLPSKPSGLSSGVTTNSSTPKVPIRNKNTAFPNDLLSYIRDHNVLLIDIRNRVDFEREHIKANAVICIEPSILMREGVTAETIENAMVIAPRQEASLFDNRDKFDLVAVYDGSSKSFGDANTPLSTLVRVISEQAFRKILKRMPMMLAGGIEAWKREVGETELVRGTSPPLEIQRPILRKDFPNSVHSPKPNGNNQFLNGTGLDFSANVVDPHEVWTPQQKSEEVTMNGSTPLEHRPLDQFSQSRSSPADPYNTGIYSPIGDRPIIRRPAVLRPSSSSISFTRSLNDTITSPVMSAQSMTNGSPPIAYPQFASPAPSAPAYGGSFTVPPMQYDIASPPQASINPSQLSRRRSDFVDQSQEALSGFKARSPIDYPELTSPTIIRPPPVAASSMERLDNRPRVQQIVPSYTPAGATGPTPPRVASDYPVNYWFDLQIGTSGLKNLGNTCYMNAPIQCLSATVPFARFFTEGRWKTAINYTNPLGSKGKLTGAFAKLLHEMWGGDLPYLTPIDFRRSICQLKSQYNGSDQHDSQEFLSFLIDGIHEDLNRIIVKPLYSPTPQEEAELERLPTQIASDREWRNWRSRNDSLIVDYFQGQFRNRLECLTCHKTSTTYNVFSILQLPIPNARSGRIPIERCLDAFFNEEILEKDDAWDCPQCKVKRRASKKLSLARLPPVLMVHFKRFEANGRFSDKIDTFVDFPMKSLDLTNYMPPPLPPGVDKSQLNGGLPLSLEDPRSQIPPYRYDLYGVTNHYGNLSSGHYTAFIASRGGWMYCDDSSVKPVDSKQVVSQKAYVLFYKRVRP